MILELRTYTLHPGKMTEYWGHYADGGQCQTKSP
jgi:hypothetical protein